MADVLELEKTIDALKHEVENSAFDMDHWFYFPMMDLLEDGNQLLAHRRQFDKAVENYNNCGTSACIAGHVSLQNHEEFKAQNTTVKRFAAMKLGLSVAEATSIFLQTYFFGGDVSKQLAVSALELLIECEEQDKDFFLTKNQFYEKYPGLEDTPWHYEHFEHMSIGNGTNICADWVGAYLRLPERHKQEVFDGNIANKKQFERYLRGQSA